MPTDETVAAWTRTLPDGATAEHVRPGFWYVRIPGESRRIIPLEIELGERTVKVTSHVIIPPEENETAFYRFLLRTNHDAPGVAFSVARDGVICLVGRIPLERFDVDALDAVTARVVETTERTFRSLLQIGFASRLRK